MVHIKELPDGLELRSTSTLEVIEFFQKYGRETFLYPYLDDISSEYELIEDHIERVEIPIIEERFIGVSGRMGICYMHVITLRRIGIDKTIKKEENSGSKKSLGNPEKGGGGEEVKC